MSTQEVDDFIAHYGKKGMRWGSRKGKIHVPLTESQTVRVALVAAGSFFVASNLVTLKTLNPKLGVIAGTAAAAAGIRYTRNQIDKKGDTPLSKITK